MKNNSIKGLIIKDLLNLNHYKISILFIIVIFLLLGVTNMDTLNFLPIMFMTMIGMIGLSTFSYDEISKADKYILTLPTNKKSIIKSKYLLIFMMTMLGAIISFIAILLINYILHQKDINLLSIITILMGGIFGVSLVECIQIPSIYKWGAEKGRIQMVVLSIIVASIIGGVGYLLTQSGFLSQINMNLLNNILNNFGIIFLLIITIIMYIMSYKISYNIYSKKDL